MLTEARATGWWDMAPATSSTGEVVVADAPAAERAWAPETLPGRSAEFRVLEDFLVSPSTDPAAVIVEGDPGIGKTTLWLAAVDLARGLGYRVLSTRAAAAESVLSYAGLADMVGDIEADAWAGLPEPQRLAMDRVLLRAGADGRATDQRAVAAGFLSVVSWLAEAMPVLLAIDDLQWLDSSSMAVVAFAARRLPSRVRILATIRSDSDCGGPPRWLHLPRPEALRRIRLQPMSLGGLRAVIAERLGRSLCRPTLVRISEVSGGNPLYALELARAIDDDTTTTEVGLPGSLAQLVADRVGGLSSQVRDVLLAASCIAAPTVDLVAAASDTGLDKVVELLEDAENKGIIDIDGHRIRFTHPLLARGVYTGAAPPRRRAMHRRLAQILEEPELTARHLALAASSHDTRTLQRLDRAAQMAHMRGAPTAAAELLDLAIRLGGDTPQRRIGLAANHFNAGDTRGARALLEQTVAQMAPGTRRAQALCLLAVISLVDAGFANAARQLRRALGEVGDSPGVRVQILTMLSFAQFNVDGPAGPAVESIEDAVTAATRLADPHLLSQALSMRVILRFLSGAGLDETSLRRALKLQDHNADTPALFRPAMHNAMVRAWTGQLEQAHQTMCDIRRGCAERGEENELIVVAFHSALTEIWRANFADAAELAEDAMERALQLGGDLPLSVALIMRAALAAYAGHEHHTRRDAAAALAGLRRCGPNLLTAWPTAIVGFLEVSLGNYDAALTALEPLLSAADPRSDATEIFTASFLPDAVEALIGTGRVDDAEPLVDALERNGRRLDRAWMLAVGARCRAMLAVARGDLAGATLAAKQAMVEHDRLPMPFERARTQLLLGQLQRRQRHREAASATLRDALSAFERMGTMLWANRARAESTRLDVGPRQAGALTRSEQRVAELAGSGMTNSKVAAALFISPKTVEAHLASIYRKLDIRSRAELGRHVSEFEK